MNMQLAILTNDIQAWLSTRTHDMEGFAIEVADNLFIYFLLYGDPIWTLNYDIDGSASSDSDRNTAAQAHLLSQQSHSTIFSSLMAAVNLKPGQLSNAVDADSSF